MKKEDIAYIIEVMHPITYRCMRVDLKANKFLVGVFVAAKDYEELKLDNKWRFIINQKLREWEKLQDITLTEIIDGEYIDTITVL